MLDAGSAAQIAEIYELGDDPLLTGPVARGEVGQVWRMTTSHGAFAVKEPFEQLSVAEADDDPAYQDAVIAAGVLMPPGRNPVDPWYTDPISVDRWDDLFVDHVLRTPAATLCWASWPTSARSPAAGGWIRRDSPNRIATPVASTSS